MLHGQAALLQQWALLGDTPTFSELSIFHTFRYWLPGDVQRTLDRHTQAALQTELVMPPKPLDVDRRSKHGKSKPSAGASSSRLFE